METEQIYAAIKQQEASETDAARFTQTVAILRKDTPIDIRIKQRTATARYIGQGTSQLAFIPMDTVLERESIDKWKIVSHEAAKRSWLYQLIDMTIGVK